MDENEYFEDSDQDSSEPEDIARDYLRISIVLSFLTQKELTIKLVDQIRPFEVSLLKLVTRITEGTRTEVDKNLINLKPGKLTGGEFVFECEKSMPLSYYLEPLVLLLPFSSQYSSVTLKYPNSTENSNKSVTNNSEGSKSENEDLYSNYQFYSSLECFCSVCTIILQLIGCEANFKYKEPFEVVFTCNPIRKIEPINLTKSPKIKRIRGSVLIRTLHPNLGKRAIIGAKRILDVVCDNTWIALSTPPGRFEPFLLISLVAEGTKNCIFTSNGHFYFKSEESPSDHGESTKSARTNGNSLKQILNLALDKPNSKDSNSKVSNSVNSNDNSKDNFNSKVAEKIKESESELLTNDNYNMFEKCEMIGERCAHRLINEISVDSVVDSTHQHLLLFFAALSGDHQVSKVRLFRLTRYSKNVLGLIKRFLGVQFQLQPIISSNFFNNSNGNTNNTNNNNNSNNNNTNNSNNINNNKDNNSKDTNVNGIGLASAKVDSGHTALIVKCVGANFVNINLKTF